MAGPGPGYAAHPDHAVRVERHSGRHRVLFNGVVVADSTRTLLLSESGHGRVHYFPLADVDGALLGESRHHTHCPFKGDASYRHLSAGGRTAENAVWFYPDPYDEVAAIAGHVAFDRTKVDDIRFGG